MNTKVEYKNDILKLMIKNEGVHIDEIKAAFYQEEGDYFVKTFSGRFENADKIADNFKRLIPYVFEDGEWERALLFIAKHCKENGIVWFLTGSVCDAVRGIDIVPHDLDITICSKHWKKAEEAFSDYIVEPFIETRGWIRDNWGRLVIHNTQIDLVADMICLHMSMSRTYGMGILFGWNHLC